MYGMIDGDELLTSDLPQDGYKPLVYAPIPPFDQETQYVVQSPPMDEGERIWVGVVVEEMPVDTSEGMP